MAASAGIDDAGQPYVWIDARARPSIRVADRDAQRGISGYCGGRMGEPGADRPLGDHHHDAGAVEAQPQFANGLDQPSLNYGPGQVDTTKYDLMRSFVDADRHALYATSEIVAEYAVDLNVAFTVDTTTTAAIRPEPHHVPFDNIDEHSLGAGRVAGSPPPAAANIGPQRIRSARARLVTRTAQADRTANMPVTNLTSEPQAFMYRYCINPAARVRHARPDARSWARARTVTTEVAAPQHIAELLLMTRALIARHRLPTPRLAAAGEAGAAMFIVAMTLAVLGVGRHVRAGRGRRTRSRRAATSGRTRRRTTWPSYGVARRAHEMVSSRRSSTSAHVSNAGQPVLVAAGRPLDGEPPCCAPADVWVGRAGQPWTGGRDHRSPTRARCRTSGRRAGQLRPHPHAGRLLRRADRADAGQAPARYATDLNFCFIEMTATSNGITQPVFAGQPNRRTTRARASRFSARASWQARCQCPR